MLELELELQMNEAEMLSDNEEDQSYIMNQMRMSEMNQDPKLSAKEDSNNLYQQSSIYRDHIQAHKLDQPDFSGRNARKINTELQLGQHVMDWLYPGP